MRCAEGGCGEGRTGGDAGEVEWGEDGKEGEWGEALLIQWALRE